jgi:hypothetical protein
METLPVGTQSATIIALLDGRDNSSDLALDSLEVESIGPELVLALSHRTVCLFLKGSKRTSCGAISSYL